MTTDANKQVKIPYNKMAAELFKQGGVQLMKRSHLSLLQSIPTLQKCNYGSGFSVAGFLSTICP